ncbi:MAG: class I SAM-dependent methyltransferase [Pirellulales bacterium]|nr:class I SAM-dependent methyltransferase [Pirellulales bacterium]
MATKEVPLENWYDHPEWFEIGFQDETQKEADFFEQAFKKYCPFKVKRVFEPACGGGRLVVEMASRGYRVTGFDLSQPMLDYTRRQLRARHLKATLFQGDMTQFKLPTQHDAAFCTFNSFRHLTTEKAARSQLQCVAESLREGGLYFLGMHLAPHDIADFCIERWSGRRDNIHVTTTLRVIASSRQTRLERLRISVLVKEFEQNGKSPQKTGMNGCSKVNGKSLQRHHGKSSIDRSPKGKVAANGCVIHRMRDEFDYRMYTAAQIRSLFKSVPDLELVEVFDFNYDIDEPQKLNDDLVDTLFVLRKR